MIRYFTFFLFFIFYTHLFATDSYKYKIVISDKTSVNIVDAQLWIQRFSNANFVKFNDEDNSFFLQTSKELNIEKLVGKLLKVNVIVYRMDKTDDESFLIEFKKMTSEQKEKYQSEQKKKIIELEEKFNNKKL